MMPYGWWVLPAIFLALLIWIAIFWIAGVL